MDLIERLKSFKFLLSKASEPTQENNELFASLFNLLRPGQVEFYKRNPQTYIQKGYTVNPNVYATINQIIKPLSTIPFHLFEVKDERALKAYNHFVQHKDFGSARLYKEKALELSDNADRQAFFKNPNECETWVDWVQGAAGFKLLTGNRFIYGLSPSGFEDMGVFTKIYNMPSQFVEIIVGDSIQPVAGYRLIVNSSVVFKPKEVLHSKYWNPNYDARFSGFVNSTRFDLASEDGTNFYGLSPMSPLVNVVKRSNDSYIASMRMLENGIPAGIISTDGGKPLSPEETRALEETYQKKFGGAQNKNRLMKSTVPLKWQSLGMNSVDMQLLDSNMADLGDIARVYNVPTALLGDPKQTKFKNVEEAEKHLWNKAIIPEADSLKADLNTMVVPGWEKLDGKKYFIDYDLSSVEALRVNTVELSKRLLSEREIGMWTANEVRLMLGQEISEDESLNKYVLKTSLQALAPPSELSKTLQILSGLSPLLANKILDKLTEEEIRKLLP